MEHRNRSPNQGDFKDYGYDESSPKPSYQDSNAPVRSYSNYDNKPNFNRNRNWNYNRGYNRDFNPNYDRGYNPNYERQDDRRYNPNYDRGYNPNYERNKPNFDNHNTNFERNKPNYNRSDYNKPDYNKPNYDRGYNPNYERKDDRGYNPNYERNKPNYERQDDFNNPQPISAKRKREIEEGEAIIENAGRYSPVNRLPSALEIQPLTDPKIAALDIKTGLIKNFPPRLISFNTDLAVYQSLLAIVYARNLFLNDDSSKEKIDFYAVPDVNQGKTTLSLFKTIHNANDCKPYPMTNPTDNENSLLFKVSNKSIPAKIAAALTHKVKTDTSTKLQAVAVGAKSCGNLLEAISIANSSFLLNYHLGIGFKTETDEIPPNFRENRSHDDDTHNSNDAATPVFMRFFLNVINKL